MIRFCHCHFEPLLLVNLAALVGVARFVMGKTREIPPSAVCSRPATQSPK